MNGITEIISFYNELDILEAHLEEHKDLVDRTIIVESHKNISGIEKPLYFEENKDRYSRFKNLTNLILPEELYTRIEGHPDGQYQIFRNNDENRRRWCYQNLNGGVSTPWVLNSDADEILDHRRWLEWLPLLREDKQCFSFYLRQYMCQVNCRVVPIVPVYRIWRSDLTPEEYYDVKKLRRQALFQTLEPRRKRPIVDPIAWHFTNCFSSGREMREKASCRPWYFGVERPEDIPGVDFFDARIGKQMDYMVYEDHPLSSWVKESFDELPEWMADNLDRFPVML